MARSARSLSVACLVAAALVILHSTSAFIATSTGSANALRGRTMRQAAKEEIVPTSSAKAGKIKPRTGAFEYSTGARNEVSLITPEVDTEGIQSYLSVSVNFIGIILIGTIGGLFEALRFFPDALIWDF